jgi:di/tricarboxylate transporter
VQLSLPELTLIIVLFATVALIISGRVRPDLVGLMLIVGLPLTGIISPEEALSGFSRSAVITIIGLFIISQALEDTGIIQWIAARMKAIGAGSELRLVALFMLAGAALSLVMNNIAAGAVLLPAAAQVARESNVAPSKILIPLSFGTLLGGMATYFTTANIIMSGILRERGLDALGMTDFALVGGLILLVGSAYMLLVGRRLLPANASSAQTASAYLLSQSLSKTYHLDERLWELRVLPGSRLAHVTLEQSRIGEALGLTVLAIWRGHRAILNPLPVEMIQPQDYLVILGREDRVSLMHDWGVEIGRPDAKSNGKRDYTVDLTEVVIPPRSGIIGSTLTDTRFRSKHQLTAVALWREGRSYRTDVGKLALQVGDAILMVGAPAKIRSLAEERDFMVLQSGHRYRPPLPHKAPIALAITIVVLLVAIFELMPTSEAMLFGVAALALTRCISLDEAYRAIEWRVIFLIAGMLPISIALVNTGLGARIGELLVGVVAPYGGMTLIAALFLLTMLLTQVIGGQVVALIIGSIAITAAEQMGVSPQAMGVAVAVACSTAFLTPIAHPVNVLMMGPGGYKPADFMRVGLPLTALVLITLLIGMRLFWGV